MTSDLMRVDRELNFVIVSDGPVSMSCKAHDLGNFGNAIIYIKNLPFRRNTDKSNSTIVLKDGHRICSTKHGLLKTLAD